MLSQMAGASVAHATRSEATPGAAEEVAGSQREWASRAVAACRWFAGAQPGPGSWRTFSLAGPWPLLHPAVHGGARRKGSQTLISVPPLKGYRQKDYFIATQGPLAHTVEDFWRMVWEWKCHTVVMLTEVQEREQVRDARRPAPCGGLPRTHSTLGGPPPPTGPTPWQPSAAEATGTGEGARLETKEAPLLLSRDRPLAFALSRHFI